MVPGRRARPNCILGQAGVCQKYGTGVRRKEIWGREAWQGKARQGSGFSTLIESATGNGKTPEGTGKLTLQHRKIGVVSARKLFAVCLR